MESIIVSLPKEEKPLVKKRKKKKKGTERRESLGRDNSESRARKKTKLLSFLLLFL